MLSRIRIFRALWLGFILTSFPVAGSVMGAEPSAELHRLRAERRAKIRATNLGANKATAAGRFGLLVIPVDFSDARLAGDWNAQTLLDRLVPDHGETLHNYFRLASNGRLDLDIVVAPLVRLVDTRRLYSDRDLQGFTRTRRLATEALTAVTDLGLELRRLDNDGPDGRAGSGDDDGQVDGVLILHAGAGTENDPSDGLIQALQFFLDEPVVSQGIAASFYAVASLHSGPGIWAHETAHLLGMEDRYDPLLHPAGASELRSVGGLGRFSLMSSGAWGTGGGYGAALPDAYSAAQLGWYRVRNLAGTGADTLKSALLTGEVARAWTRGQTGPEFFLLETRSPALSAPFDADVPAGQLLVYHIDENLSEGNYQEDGPYQWHLRVKLVEADGDESLAYGEDQGRAQDLFPGPLGATDFRPTSVPSSWGYYNGASHVALTDITELDAGISFGVSLDTARSLSFEVAFAPDAERWVMDLVARETGEPLLEPRCEVAAVANSEYGNFAGTGTSAVDFALIETEPGVWRPAQPITWLANSELPVDARTRFRYRFSGGGADYADESRWWAWRTSGQALDFRGAWPGTWNIGQVDENSTTTWHRWDQAPWVTADQAAILACTGATFETAALWPEVTYQNGAHTTLTSAPLDAPVTGVRLTHAIEVEMLNARTAMDGGLVVWIGPDGQEVPALPVAGYGGQISTRAVNPRHGQDAFVAGSLEFSGAVPIWRSDTFALPTDGPGPWRLRLVFAGNRQWRARGWFIAAIEAVVDQSPVRGFTPRWDGDLVWSWPWPDADSGAFTIQSRPDEAAPWQAVLTGAGESWGDGQFGVAGTSVLRALGPGPRQRHQVRVLGPRPVGTVASAPVVVYPDGGAGPENPGAEAIFGQPWPNPTASGVRFLLDVPSGQTGTLNIYDLRGRLLRSQRHGSGQQLVVWDGRDDNGARLAAGIYYLRLEGTGPILTRKVVLIH